MGVVARLGAEPGGDVVGGAFPIDEEVLGGGVDVDEAGGVGWSTVIGEQWCVERSCQGVGGEHVVACVAYPGRGVCRPCSAMLGRPRTASLH